MADHQHQYRPADHVADGDPVPPYHEDDEPGVDREALAHVAENLEEHVEEALEPIVQALEDIRDRIGGNIDDSSLTDFIVHVNNRLAEGQPISQRLKSIEESLENARPISQRLKIIEESLGEDHPICQKLDDVQRILRSNTVASNLVILNKSLSVIDALLKKEVLPAIEELPPEIDKIRVTLEGQSAELGKIRQTIEEKNTTCSPDEPLYQLAQKVLGEFAPQKPLKKALLTIAAYLGDEKSALTAGQSLMQMNESIKKMSAILDVVNTNLVYGMESLKKVLDAGNRNTVESIIPDLISIKDALDQISERPSPSGKPAKETDALSERNEKAEEDETELQDDVPDQDQDRGASTQLEVMNQILAQQYLFLRWFDLAWYEYLFSTAFAWIK